MHRPLLLLPLFALPAGALDQNNNQQSDVWELAFGASGLPAAADADGDGYTNATESLAGTNPLSALDFPALEMAAEGGAFRFRWHGVAGKRYAMLASEGLNPASWAAASGNMTGSGGIDTAGVSAGVFSRRFFKMSVSDQDTDADGFSDADEALVGLTRGRTGPGGIRNWTARVWPLD